MAIPGNMFVAEARRVWMRRHDHTVVSERDPEFARFATDPSGSVLRIVRIWVVEPDSLLPQMERYVGSVRRWEGGGWLSHRELRRFYRRATLAAHHLGQDVRTFRAGLSRYLRGFFSER